MVYNLSRFRQNEFYFCKIKVVFRFVLFVFYIKVVTKRFLVADNNFMDVSINHQTST